MLGVTLQYFHTCEHVLVANVTRMVEQIPEIEEEIRCHELARAVAQILGEGFDVQDGWYNVVEHSWIMVRPPWSPTTRILDVYTPGCLPLVQLLACNPKLPHRESYRLGVPRDDIDHARVEWLVRQMEVEPQPAEPARLDATA